MTTCLPQIASQSASVLFLFAFAATLVAIFAPGLFQSQIPAFRDAYHFYYPQAVWLDHCVAAGDYFPSWNRFDGLGSSVVGQVSSALYYPLRVISLIPGLSVASRFSLLIVIHLFLAGIGAYVAARALKLDSTPASLAGISFALSCPVFFQHNNLIYLCSAAWIGFCLTGLIEFAFNQRFLKGLLHFSFSLSMMVLAGDPHTAMNALIVSVLVLLGVSITSRAWRRAAAQASWFAFALALILSATAIQWIPAARWAQHSGRILDFSPQSVLNVERLETEHRELVETLDSFEIVPPPRFDFSLSPWHLPSVIWPSIGGHYLPNNSRWFTAIPSEGRMWVPSLYFGLLPTALFLLGAFLCNRNRWLFWISLFSLCAALGNYSPLWAAREIMALFGMNEVSNQLPADSVGSVYGLLTAIVPGYDAFRYPAKWTAWFAVAASLFAAASFQSCLERPSVYHRLAKTGGRLVGLASIAIAACGAGLFLLEPESVALTMPMDAWLGRADIKSIAFSLVFSGSIPLAVLALLRLIQSERLRAVRAESLVLLTLVELAACSLLWTCFCAPPQPNAIAIAPTTDAFVWADISAANFGNQTDHLSSLVERQTSLQNDFLVGKLATLADTRNLSAIQSVEPLITEKLRTWLLAKDNLRREQPELDQVLESLGITHRLILEKEVSHTDIDWDRNFESETSVPNLFPFRSWSRSVCDIRDRLALAFFR